MNILRVSMIMLFIATLCNAAFAGQDNDKDKGGTKGKDSKPDCDYTSVSDDSVV